MESSKASNSPILQIKGICKRFPGVQALTDAAFALYRGEIHALVGENGAGKSTLIKILTGVQRADSGSINFDSRFVEFDSPLKAQRAGIATIYQEFTLIPHLSIRDNLFLGRETKRGVFIDGRGEMRLSRSMLEKLGLEVDPLRRVSTLSPAQQQLVEISRALLSKARILVMDEPTAALTPAEVKRLFDILREQVKQGLSVIFISHRLDEVFEISDQITVMRDGATVDNRATPNYSRKQLIEQMVGRSIETEYPRVKSEMREGGLEVRNLRGPNVKDVSFAARRGEILGFAGLMGAGRTDVVRSIFGASEADSGEIYLDGKQLVIRTPRDAITGGICLLTEDRKSQGLVLFASALENFALPNLQSWSRISFLKKSRELERFNHHVESLRIKIASPAQRADSLSGGNQQKLLIARWLELNSQVVIFDEPTRGIDVGAKYEMYLLIGHLAAVGKVIIMVSSELPELLGICNRILVMRRGQISGEITDVASASQEEVMALAV